MAQSWACNDSSCRYDFDSPMDLDGLDEVIEHIRSIHKLSYLIRRQNAVGVPDNHGHLWYCFHPWCGARTEKGHKSFDSHKAMWNHLNDCHQGEFDMIVRVQYDPILNSNPPALPLRGYSSKAEVDPIYSCV
jgi:hypothetical protein